jgi:hypothetical protein
MRQGYNKQVRLLLKVLPVLKICMVASYARLWTDNTRGICLMFDYYLKMKGLQKAFVRHLLVIWLVTHAQYMSY